MKIKTLAILTFAILLVSCSGDSGNVKKFVADTKKKTRGKVASLPIMDIPEQVSYTSRSLRSPFSKSGSAIDQEMVFSRKEQAVRDLERKIEKLEQYPLASLKLKGVLESANTSWGLVVDSDGYMHKVQVGNYIGHNSGRVVEITPTKLIIMEKWDDGSGNVQEQEKYLKLTN